MDSKLLTIFPFITNSVKLFDNQNRFLKKIILTGKICALEKAANLFSFTEKTIETFSDLKEELIPLLIRENLKKYTEELSSKAQISIDILMRNLFERTADVGFLATDSEIISFLIGNLSEDHLRRRLIEYTLKYSVYNDIVIVDTDFNIRMNMCGGKSGKSSDLILQKALRTDSYVEQYGYSDLVSSQNKSLLFAQKIVDGNNIIGILVLSFKFDDEMRRIFGSLLGLGESILFTDDKEIITSSSSEKVTFNRKFTEIDNDYLLVGDFLYTAAKTKGYEGYFGQPWKSIAYINIKKSTLNAPKKDSIQQKSTLDDGIKAIISKADDVIEDLSDVIINGELIASKERVYVLTPVLDNLRNISTAILETIKDTVENLENTIMDGLIYEAKASSKLAIDIMDRNLYERANDCRWWALTPIFQELLASDTPDISQMNNILNYINSLYTVYTNLFIYDRYSMIVAASTDQSILGKKISGDAIIKTLSNRSTQNYYVSPFENTPFYNNQVTYIYHATIQQNNSAVGGIGIVFDATPQFKAILNDSFPHGKNGFNCFINRKGIVIATNHPTLNVLDAIEITDEIQRFSAKEPIHRFMDYDGKKYLVGIAFSQGYREYKVDDNYKNDLLCLTFIEY
ncbi:MAG: hypothetical protein PHO27_00035 [Sulfuricurvum sp.]|nr:hypothetical protein [Sulfuricurvum sp.]